MQVTSIYVLPTEEGMPPRALLMDLGELMDEEGSGQGAGAMAVWTADMGCWTLAGTPLPADLSEAITEHAKDLGVNWD